MSQTTVTIDLNLHALITETVLAALEDPQRVLARLGLYETAEEKQRHVEYGMSILRYALAGYLTGVIDDVTAIAVAVEPFDGEVDIDFPECEQTTLVVAYPAWLSSFFEDETRFTYLKADSAVPLAAVLEDMRITIGAPLEVVDAEAEAPQSDDPGGESAEIESEDPNPDLDLGKIDA